MHLYCHHGSEAEAFPTACSHHHRPITAQHDAATGLYHADYSYIHPYHPNSTPMTNPDPYSATAGHTTTTASHHHQQQHGFNKRPSPPPCFVPPLHPSHATHIWNSRTPAATSSTLPRTYIHEQGSCPCPTCLGMCRRHADMSRVYDASDFALCDYRCGKRMEMRLGLELGMGERGLEGRMVRMERIIAEKMVQETLRGEEERFEVKKPEEEKEKAEKEEAEKRKLQSKNGNSKNVKTKNHMEYSIVRYRRKRSFSDFAWVRRRVPREGN